MKRTWLLAMAMVAAVGFARTANADDAPETVATSRVTFYMELGSMPGGKAEALVALLRREFPSAKVELIEGSLRVQTDGATFEGIQKVLEAQDLPGLPAPGGKEEGKKINRARLERLEKKDVLVPERGDAPKAERDEQVRAIHEYLLRLGKELGAAGGEAASVRVKVGDLCEGCADCLAAALGKQFPRLRFDADGTEVVVVADRSGQAAVQTWLADLRTAAKDGARKLATLPHVRMLAPEEGIVVLESEDGQEGRILLKGDAPKRAPGLEELKERLKDLEKRLQAAREAGREREVQDLEAALERTREKVRSAPWTLVEPPVARRGEDAPDIGALRERMEHLRARLEGVREGHPGKPGADRPKDARTKEQAHGPMAEWRQRIQHLQQAVEHLNAAGWESLAKQAAQAVEVTKKQAEEVAAKLRAAEEAQAAERRKAAVRMEEEARAREHKQARGESGLEREGGDELTTLIRRLHQQVEELRKEVRELREKVGGERHDQR